MESVRKVLSSLQGLGRLVDLFPSTKVLGYFRRIGRAEPELRYETRLAFSNRKLFLADALSPAPRVKIDECRRIRLRPPSWVMSLRFIRAPVASVLVNRKLLLAGALRHSRKAQVTRLAKLSKSTSVRE